MSRDLWFDDLDEPSAEDPDAERRRARIAERARQRREGGRGGGNSPRRLIGLLAAVVGIVVVGGLLLALFQPFAGDGDGEPFRLEVPSGAGVGEIGSLLVDRGVIDNAFLFEVRVTLAGRRLDPEVAERIVERFLGTDFEGGRHERRVDEITEIERG